MRTDPKAFNYLFYIGDKSETVMSHRPRFFFDTPNANLRIYLLFLACQQRRVC